MKSVNISTYSARKDTLPKVIDCFLNQTVKPDVIRIWVNDYKPEPIKADIPIEFHHNGWDLTDRGKYVWLDNIRATGKHEVFFSSDDDIAYPEDYIERTLSRMKDFPNHVVTYHGRKLKGKGLNYYYGHEAHHCLRSGEDALIDVGGTGVMAFDTRTFIPDIIQYPEQCMVDVLMGLECAKHNIPIMCLKRDKGWLKDYPITESIYKSHSKRCGRQSQLADEIYRLRYD